MKLGQGGELGTIGTIVAILAAAGLTLTAMDKREDIRAKKAESKEKMAKAKSVKIDAKKRRKVETIGAKTEKIKAKQRVKLKKLDIKALKLKVKMKKIGIKGMGRSAAGSEIPSPRFSKTPPSDAHKIHVMTKEEGKHLKKCRKKKRFYRKRREMCEELFKRWP